MRRMILFLPLRETLLSCCNTSKIIYGGSSGKFFSRYNHNISPQTTIVEKSLENPVIVMSENDDVEIIGPPDSISNLRPVIRKKLSNETKLQCQLRKMQDATQTWNQEFWANHNKDFIKQRDEYIKHHQAESNQHLSADEMSNFYKDFLDKNWERHLKYNFEWYKKNFTLLVLAFKVNVEKSISKLKLDFK